MHVPSVVMGDYMRKVIASITITNNNFTVLLSPSLGYLNRGHDPKRDSENNALGHSKSLVLITSLAMEFVVLAEQ